MSQNQQLARVSAGDMLVMPQLGQPSIQPLYPGLDIITLASHLAKSGYFSDAKSESQAIVKVLFGQEIGISPIASMTGIHVIEGKPSIGAGIMAAAIKKSKKYDFRIIVSNDFDCQLEFFEEGQSVGTLGMTIEEATAAGLTSNGYGKPKANWQRTPSDMLFARVISRGMRRFAPDVFSQTYYTPDELETETDVAGNAVVASAPEPPSGRQKVTTPKTSPAPSTATASTENSLTFKKGACAGRTPADCPTEFLEGCIKRWDGGAAVRPEMRAEVERVLAERTKDYAEAMDEGVEEATEDDVAEGEVSETAPVDGETTDAETIPEAEVVLEPEIASEPAPVESAPAGEATPPKRRISSAVQKLIIACEQQGLSMAAQFRAERIDVVSRFLKAHGHDGIESFNDLTPALAFKVMTEVNFKLLSWGPLPTAAAEVEEAE
jgi:hypothetical protein